MSKEKVIRVGSRKSELALIQTKHVISLLKEIHPDREFEIVTMSTLGDKILNIPLPKIGEKSLFTRELEIALSTGCVDFVVHSLKDLPTTLPDEMVIGAVLEREDPCDALVLHKDYSDHDLSTLPKDSVIGTSSLRRSAQLHRKYPHLKVVDIRGNLNTRLQKLDDPKNGFQAIILAVAGLYRMNWNSRISKIIDSDDLLYAVGQGALAVECRENDEATLELLKSIYDPRTAVRIIAERTFLRTLGGGCSAPVGIRTELKSTDNSMELSMTGGVWSLSGEDEVVEDISCKLPLIPENVCADCPVKNKKISTIKEGNSSKDNNCCGKEGDIECLQTCGVKKKCENGGSKCPYAPPNKKLKLADETDKIETQNGHDETDTNSVEVDPHKHCPVKLPIGADFMGKCPFLHNNNFTGKCPVSGQILGSSALHGMKCPFMKDGVLQSLHEDNKIENEQGSEQKSQRSNIFCGVVPHPDVNVKIFEEAEKLGVTLAENLIAKGASSIMAKAQAHIRGN